jgi:hypothetical protein
VLQVLADPGHPDLPAKLRLAASAVTIHKRGDLPLWLQGGLVTHLLNILRALPTIALDPAEAADICAAAAAVLFNVIRVARACGAMPGLQSSTPHKSIASQVASPAVLSAVVQYGMLGPAAQEPLPPGREVPHIELIRSRLPTAPAVRHSHPLWTPLRLCGSLIVEIFTFTLCLDLSGASQTDGAVLEVQAVVAPLAREAVFHHLLLTAPGDLNGT